MPIGWRHAVISNFDDVQSIGECLRKLSATGRGSSRSWATCYHPAERSPHHYHWIYFESSNNYTRKRALLGQHPGVGFKTIALRCFDCAVLYFKRGKYSVFLTFSSVLMPKACFTYRAPSSRRISRGSRGEPPM